MSDPPIVKTIATENKGIEDLAAAIESYCGYQTDAQDSARERKTSIARWRLTELLRERLLEQILEGNGTGEKLDELAGLVADKRTDPYSAVEEILKHR